MHRGRIGAPRWFVPYSAGLVTMDLGFMPNRRPAIPGDLVGAVGAVAGVGIVVLLVRMAQRSRESPLAGRARDG